MDAQYRTDLPIGTMVLFEHGPFMRPGLTGANATVQFTGVKRSVQQDGTSSKKLTPYNIGCFALMSSPFYVDMQFVSTYDPKY